MLSFHETGAQILRIHADNEQSVIRGSRSLEFQTDDGSIPKDALVMLTWLLAAPLGDTSFSALQNSHRRCKLLSKRRSEASLFAQNSSYCPGFDTLYILVLSS